MKNINRFLAFILVFSMAVSLFACGEKGSKEAGSGQSEGNVSSQYVLDGAGREIVLPEDPEQVTIASVYAVSVPLLEALKVTERVVAINLKSRFWSSADPNLQVTSVGKGVVDLEALASVAPGVFIHRSNDPETIEAVENIGIPTICITIENMDDIKEALGYLGKYLGAEEEAAKSIAWIDDKFAKLDEIVAGIPEEERKTALMMGGELGRVAGNDMLQSWMIEKAGGICVADTGKDHSWINVGLEKVFEWNPEYLFCTSSTMLDYNREGLLEDPTWEAMQAIQAGNVDIMPAQIDSWDMPGLSCILGCYYMLYRMYPDYFSKEELEAEIDDYYTFMFGKTFTAEELNYSL